MKQSCGTGINPARSILRPPALFPVSGSVDDAQNLEARGVWQIVDQYQGGPVNDRFKCPGNTSFMAGRHVRKLNDLVLSAFSHQSSILSTLGADLCQLTQKIRTTPHGPAYFSAHAASLANAALMISSASRMTSSCAIPSPASISAIACSIPATISASLSA